MRTEIAEVAEPFGKDQVGSSTMAHKRNPINFEGLEGGWIKTKNEFGKVLDTLRFFLFYLSIKKSKKLAPYLHMLPIDLKPIDWQS